MAAAISVGIGRLGPIRPLVTREARLRGERPELQDERTKGLMTGKYSYFRRSTGQFRRATAVDPNRGSRITDEVPPCA